MKQSNKRTFQDIQLSSPIPAWEKFHTESSLGMIGSIRNPIPPPQEWVTVRYKGYARFAETILPKAKSITRDFGTLLDSRESKRSYSHEKIPLTHISTLLKYGLGVKSKATSNPQESKRYYPSAGARYPIEAYIFSQHSELKNGIYHYYIKHHSLERLWDIKKHHLKDIFYETWIQDAPIIMLLTGRISRSTSKYGNRGYRFALMETGYIGQLIYLLSTHLGLGCCAIGGFNDENARRVLDLKDEEYPLSGFTIGFLSGD